MKRSIYIILVSSALLAASCAKDPGLSLDHTANPVAVTVSIDPETKATIGEEDGVFLFSSGDAIKIYNGTNTYSGTTTADGSASASFTMEEGFTETGSGYAGFPAGLVDGITGSGVIFTLPANYTYADVGASDANAAKVPCPMVGTYTAGGAISLKHAGAVVRFRLTNVAAGSLTFTFPDVVTGTLKSAMGTPGDGDGITGGNLNYPGHSITVLGVPETGAGNYVYITLPVPKGTRQGGILIVNTPDNASALRVAAIAESEATLNRAGGHKFGVSLTTSTTGTFKISDTKTVALAPGNLMAQIGSFTSPAATASNWRFGGSFEYIGESPSAGNKLFASSNEACVGKWVDLFSWQGNSATAKVHGLVNSGSNRLDYHGNGYAEVVYAGCWDTGEGGISITNGGTYTWAPMSWDEWLYLLYTRSGATVNATTPSRFARATIAGVYGMLLFPDSAGEIWTTAMGTAPASINSTGADGNNSYTAVNYAAMASAGIVFLPAAGYRNGSNVGDVGSIGYYWTSKAHSSTVDVYGVTFVFSYVTSSGNANTGPRNRGRSVRLVRVIN